MGSGVGEDLHAVEQMLGFVRAPTDLTRSGRKNLAVQAGRQHDRIAVQQLGSESLMPTRHCSASEYKCLDFPALALGFYSHTP